MKTIGMKWYNEICVLAAIHILLLYNFGIKFFMIVYLSTKAFTATVSTRITTSGYWACHDENYKKKCRHFVSNWMWLLQKNENYEAVFILLFNTSLKHILTASHRFSNVPRVNWQRGRSVSMFTTNVQANVYYVNWPSKARLTNQDSFFKWRQWIIDVSIDIQRVFENIYSLNVIWRFG